MSKISVCIITKNEEKNLAKCLTALKPYPFEVVVVDTGSTDNTRQIAINSGAKVYDFEWVKDFSAARNFSISKASNDWILVLDSDEFVTELNYDALLAFQTEHPTSIGRLTRKSPDFQDNITIDEVERYFDRRIFQYDRPIHEQVTPIQNIPIVNVPIPVVCDHSGYFTPELAKAKADRNNELLEKYLLTHPDDTYTYFQLGQSYYMTKDFEKALPYFEKALSYDLAPEAEYVQMLVTSYGYTLLYLERLEDAIQFIEQIYDYFNTYADFVFLLGACYIRSGAYIKAIQQFVRCTTLSNFKAAGVTTYMPLYNLGLLYDALGERQMAISFFEKAAPNYKPAENEYQRLKLELQK